MTPPSRNWRIIAWILASPFIILVAWAINMPLTVSLYYSLSPHPARIHGEQPEELAGLFISEDGESDDPFALVLRSDGRRNIYKWSGESYWHVDGETLYTDWFPVNCQVPSVPSRYLNEYDFELVDSEKLILKSDRAGSRFDGSHILVRTNVDQKLWNEVNRLKDEPGFSLRAHRIWVALMYAGVLEDDPSTWDDLEPAAH